MTIGGPLQPFMIGIGMVAVEGRLSVIPIRLDIHHPGKPIRFPILRRGRVDVCFGKPVSFTAHTSYIEATATIEDAVKSV